MASNNETVKLCLAQVTGMALLFTLLLPLPPLLLPLGLLQLLSFFFV